MSLESLKQVQTQEKICNCKNSKCMKLYCECFSAGLGCNKNCKCTDCKNNKNHDQLIHPIQYKGGPSLKYLKNQYQQKENKGCSCRKSFCIKKYCECFGEGILCGEHCKCVQCQNNISITNKNVITNLKKNTSTTSNKQTSLYPIILTPNSDHITHIIAQDNALDLSESWVDQNVKKLFKSAETGGIDKIIMQFMDILKAISNKSTKMETDGDQQLNRQQISKIQEDCKVNESENDQ